MERLQVSVRCINNDNINIINEKVQRNGVDVKTASQKPPRDPRSQINSTEKLTHVDSNHNNYELMNYETDGNLNRGSRSSSLSKLGEQNYKQMYEYPISKYPQQEQMQYEEPMNIHENQFQGFEDEEQAFRGIDSLNCLFN